MNQVAAWTNDSVLRLANGGDPVAAIAVRARQVVLDALDRGWSGPPYDPFKLAEFMNVRLQPSVKGVTDARTVPDEHTDNGIRVEYNPNRPNGRLRFNLAHELAHALFPDVAAQVRHRTPMGAVAGFTGEDDWQLEMLCNVAASEFLMPAQTLEDLGVSGRIEIDGLMAVRKRLEVSTEALLRRVVALTEEPVTMFTAHRRLDSVDSDFQVDYDQPSRTSQLKVRSGHIIPSSSTLSHCTAVGYTSSDYVSWPINHGHMRVEAVGIPAYPGRQLPRVAGLLLPVGEGERERQTHGLVREVTGDLFHLRGDGPFLILHVVNDRARKWAGPFGSRLARRYASAAKSYTSWVLSQPEGLHLGAIHIAEEPGGPTICSLVAQEGYGPSSSPRIRYPALSQALSSAAAVAVAGRFSVHAPAIGSGQAGGRWDVIRDEIDRTLARQGVDVTIYRLPA